MPLGVILVLTDVIRGRYSKSPLSLQRNTGVPIHRILLITGHRPLGFNWLLNTLSLHNLSIQTWVSRCQLPCINHIILPHDKSFLLAPTALRLMLNYVSTSRRSLFILYFLCTLNYPASVILGRLHSLWSSSRLLRMSSWLKYFRLRSVRCLHQVPHLFFIYWYSIIALSNKVYWRDWSLLDNQIILLYNVLVSSLRST